MKRICLVFVLLVLSYHADAQSDDVVKLLSRVGESGARIVVNSEVKLQSSSLMPSEKLRGFRVRIFFDNKQTSRADAIAAETKFKELYPNLNTYTEYVPPYFKVTAGDFLTRLEAVAIWGKIKYAFPTAFVVSENIPYGSLIVDRRNIVKTSDDLLEEAEGVIE